MARERAGGITRSGGEVEMGSHVRRPDRSGSMSSFQYSADSCGRGVVRRPIDSQNKLRSSGEGKTSSWGGLHKGSLAPPRSIRTELQLSIEA